MAENLQKHDDPVWKSLSRKNGDINKLTKEGLQKELAKLKLDTRGHKDVLKKRLKNFWKKQMLAQSRVCTPKEQCYDYLLVIDFEATCERDGGTHYRHEIIEFPIVLVDAVEHKVVDEFHAYVKPSFNPKLTAFCSELTGIQQEDVDKAALFPSVLADVERWMESHALGTKHTFAVATDGPWDMGRFMYLQCVHSGITFPRWCRKWVNVRKAFSTFYKLRAGKLQTNLEILQLPHMGRLHSGIDDSRNIAAIVVRMLDDGCVFRVNERLFCRKLEWLNRRLNNDSQEGEGDDPVVVSVTGDSSDLDDAGDDDGLSHSTIVSSSEGTSKTSVCDTTCTAVCVCDNGSGDCKACIESSSSQRESADEFKLSNNNNVAKSTCDKRSGIELNVDTKRDVNDDNIEDLLVYFSLRNK